MDPSIKVASSVSANMVCTCYSTTVSEKIEGIDSHAQSEKQTENLKEKVFDPKGTSVKRFTYHYDVRHGTYKNYLPAHESNTLPFL